MSSRSIDKLLLMIVILPWTFVLANEVPVGDMISVGTDSEVDNGWMEIRSSDSQHNSNSSEQQPSEQETMGDKLYYVEVGETLASIAEKFTGSSTNWHQIATHNDVLDPESVSPGTLILIPAELLSNKNKSRTENPSQIREFKPILLNEEATSLKAKKLEDAVTQNLDMFIGEVRVLGKVAVTRVALGKGSVLRAEVLASGELLVIAQSMGSTSLRLWHQDGRQSDYNIRVSETDPETRFQMEKMVRFRVKMVEFRKSALGRLGIDWGDSVAGPTFATAGDIVTNSIFRPAAEGFSETLPGNVRPFSSYFGIASSLTSRINFLSSTGDAVLLAEPTLSCTNGGTANFLAGGEVPYPTVGANGQTTVEFKEYGIKLDISPQIDTAGNVRTSVMTEISSIDPAVSVLGAPGLLTRRTQTQVNVRTGQTIVIAGLLKAENSSDLDKLPGIGNMPVLGRLFKSENMRNDISELVIFITPEVLDPDSDGMSQSDRQIHSISDARLNKAQDRLKLNLLE